MHLLNSPAQKQIQYSSKLIKTKMQKKLQLNILYIYVSFMYLIQLY